MSKTLSKALYLLTLFDESSPLQRLQDLSQKANMPKPTTYRLLKTLEEYGFVQKANFYQNGMHVDTDCYQLGLKCLELGAIVANQFEVRKVALPYMTQLRDDLQESVQLVVQEGKEAVYIEKVDTNKPVRLYTRIGRRAPLYAGACPRVLLAFMPDEEIRRLIKGNLMKITSKTLIDKDKLWHVIRETRQKGFTYSASELEEGTAAFGVPIFNQSGKVAASLSVAGFESTLRQDRYFEYVSEMWKVAADISNQLGYPSEYPYFQEKIQGGTR